MPPPWRRGRYWSAASWVALALLGLVLAAAISLAASRLSRQHIGLSSEPLRAGQRLTPAEDAKRRRPPVRHGAPHTPPRQTPSQPAQPSDAGSPGDDSGVGEAGDD